jgi:hypothetical protein
MFRKILFTLISFPVFFSVLTQSAPAPWGFAINVEKKECGNFWPGDEFVSYKLPEGWEYYASFDRAQDSTPSGEVGISFITIAGTCKLQDEKAYGKNDYTECCRNLGLSVVEVPKGKSDGPAESLKSVAQIFPIIIIIILVCVLIPCILSLALFIKYKLSKKLIKN